MENEPRSTPARTKLLVFVMVLVVAAAFAAWYWGNPISALLEWWSPGMGSPTLSNQSLTLPTALSQKTWQDLALHGQLPIEVQTSGRSNPFVSVEVVPNPNDRDARRVADIKAIRDALRAHFVAYGKYPDGNNVIVGSVDAACLTNQGWQPRPVCVFNVGVVPMPADPGSLSYVYQATTDGYEIGFTLEGSSAGYPAGSHTLTPKGIQ